MLLLQWCLMHSEGAERFRKKPPLLALEFIAATTMRCQFLFSKRTCVFLKALLRRSEKVRRFLCYARPAQLFCKRPRLKQRSYIPRDPRLPTAAEPPSRTFGPTRWHALSVPSPFICPRDFGSQKSPVVINGLALSVAI
jgi:hypothetical protein